MPTSPQPLESRVEKLEERVTILEQLPARVDDLTSQIVQLREEMRGEFSAVRAEIRESEGKTGGLVNDLRREMLELNDGLRRHMLELHEDLRRQMLVLHEDVIGRFALLQDARGDAPPRPTRRRPKR